MTDETDGGVIRTLDWTKIVVAAVTAMVTLAGTLGTVYLRHVLSDDTDRVSVALESSRQVNNRLRALLQAEGVDRVVVNQFHNGVRFASGREYEKITTTHTVSRPGISSAAGAIRGLPITLFEDVLIEVQSESSVYYESADSVPGTMRSVMRETGVRSVYMVKIEGINGRYIGLLQLQSVRGGLSTGLRSSGVKAATRTADAIGAYMSLEQSS